MAEELLVSGITKKERYESLLPQLKALLEGEKDLTANLANCCAALKTAMNFFWVGFYLVKDDELVLGPFQGTVACTRIAKGKGVCGSSWLEKKTIIVEDVNAFPGHIACSSASKSEIVVPGINKNGNVEFVLDVDEDEYNQFDETDQTFLEKIVLLIVANHYH
jgi:L-methionine (R)-S-oxide reductase